MRQEDPSQAQAAPGGYPPIQDYAVIGNCRTVAHVSHEGSIEWLCLPNFSSPSIFAAMLDRRRGGSFSLRPRDVQRVERRYVPASNVLETRFHCAEGVLKLTDFMPLFAIGQYDGELHPEHELGRIATCEAGRVTLEALYAPRPDYGKRVPRLTKRGRLGWAWQSGAEVAFLQSDMDLVPAGEAQLAGLAALACGETRRFSLAYASGEICPLPPLDGLQRRLDETLRWWKGWCVQCVYDGPYADQVLRSALALKLLDYALSGAVIAAPTTSLPEGCTGKRNWDYRYCWLRDTSLVLQSFMDLGFTEESEAFLGWLLHATRLTWPRLQVLYDVYGETSLAEHELPQLEGYRGLGPVRVGNDAHAQLQLDIYGEVVLTAYDFVQRGGELDATEKRLLQGFGRAVCELWREPDKSIWEIRRPPRHNTYSKLMCWVALDRLLKLKERNGLDIPEAAYRRTLEEMRAEIDARGYNRELNAYVGYYEGSDPDASLLLLARYGYIKEDDPRMRGTHRLITQRLSHKGFLYRYPPGGEYDGVPGPESLFALCSFWEVDYLVRCGLVDRARELFERLLALANDVGLYAEEFDPETLAPMGNFPQAFTHVGVITAALALKQAAEGKRGKEIAR